MHAGVYYRKAFNGDLDADGQLLVLERTFSDRL